MKTIVRIIALLSISITTFAHDSHQGTAHVRHWHIQGVKNEVHASFYVYKQGEVYLETTGENIIHYPLASFSATDQAYIAKRNEAIERLNHQIAQAQHVSSPHSQPLPVTTSVPLYMFVVCMVLLTVAGVYLVVKRTNTMSRIIIPVLCFTSVALLLGFTERIERKLLSITDPHFVDEAFSPFKGKVNTRWDDKYFYVESVGIADHEMMAGITAWQQQVPIPQCYIDANAWSIPLNPEVAATPVPVSPQHFLRGAVAVAVNGIPIFNPYTNTGVDAQVDGQLDVYGGHSGRADDYHYHIAPLHLYQQTKQTLPIAFGLDGFAVYGEKEPDGTPMQSLDSNHGHYGTNGVYHYHGTKAAPYMIGRMVGKVTEDNTLQIIPQASAKPVRPSLTPLKGATITKCVPNGTNNGYKLTYTLSNQEYHVEYSWTQNGKYTYNFISPTGTKTENYNGAVICSVPTSIEDAVEFSSDVTVSPNPSLGVVRITLANTVHEHDVLSVDVYSLTGNAILQHKGFTSWFDTKNFSAGMYVVTVRFRSHSVTKKLIIP